MYLWCQGFRHVPSKTSERQPAEWGRWNGVGGAPLFLPTTQLFFNTNQGLLLSSNPIFPSPILTRFGCWLCRGDHLGQHVSAQTLCPDCLFPQLLPASRHSFLAFYRPIASATDAVPHLGLLEHKAGCRGLAKPKLYFRAVPGRARHIIISLKPFNHAHGESRI